MHNKCTCRGCSRLPGVKVANKVGAHPSFRSQMVEDTTKAELVDQLGGRRGIKLSAMKFDLRLSLDDGRANL